MAPPRLYMDWNATAPLLSEARDAMLAGLALVGNPNSVHGEGRAARAALEAARRQVAALGNAAPAQVIFTGGATEAANLVLTPQFTMGRTPIRLGALYASAIEHPAVREGGRFPTEARQEIPVTSEGIVDLTALEALLSGHDKGRGLPMVAVMLVNNETGIVQPVRAAADLVHAHGGLIVVDAVQAAGRLSLDMEALGADFLLLSAHKIGGPKGVGALVCRGEVLMPAPLLRGGGQERGHRSGTENVAAIMGFGAAAAAALADFESRNRQIAALRDRLEAAMRQAAPDVVIHGQGLARVANTSFFTLPGLKSETGQIAFDLEGVALSAGSACASGRVGESHVLTAMGRDPSEGALRISIGPATDAAEIDRVAEIFARIAGRRRRADAAA